MHMKVDIGEAEPRTIVAGIAEAYAPEELLESQSRHRSEFATAQAERHRIERNDRGGVCRRRQTGAGRLPRGDSGGSAFEVSLVDSHCHLDDEKFDADRAQVIERALAAGVETMMAIGTGGELDVAIQQAERYPFIYATIGVHPHDAAKATPDTFARLRDLAAHPKVLAIGEIGLDYHYDFSPRDVQRSVFERQLELAAEFGKPIVIHTREAWEDTMAQVTSLPHGGIMHCFTGDAAQAQQALDLGFHLSFGGVLTFPKAESLARSRANRPRRPPPRRDGLPVPGPGAASGQAQRTGLRGGYGAPPGGRARRHAGGRLPNVPLVISATYVCEGRPVTVKLVNLHEFRQAGTGADSS